MATGKESDVEARVLALAHQLGRLIGTVERKAQGLLDRDALNKQVTQIRDSANELLDHLGGAIASGRAETAGKPRGKRTTNTPGKARDE
jgi:hypothetical protein